MVPAYRARKRRSFGRTLWRLLWRGAGSALVVVVLVVAALRVVDPPTTAFILAARFEAGQAGNALTVDRRWVDLDCLPDHLALAVLAAEDQKFAFHHGFDVAQIADALEEARQGGRLRGASTLSQQTAKNLFLWGGQSWLRKGLEAGLTALLELLVPKRRILEIYLNVAELGHGIYGVEAAARRYFGKPAARLTAAESALLAAVLPSPRRYSATAPGAHVRERQRWILGQLPTVRQLPGVGGLLARQDRCPPAA